jgi:hypothetical protein
MQMQPAAAARRVIHSALSHAQLARLPCFRNNDAILEMGRMRRDWWAGSTEYLHIPRVYTYEDLQAIEEETRLSLPFPWSY